MKKSYISILILLVVIVLFFGTITYFITEHSKNKVLDETVQIFKNQPGQLPYTDLSGNPISLDSYLSKILVVVSWASWSPFTQNDFNTLLELSSKYSSEDVIFMAINRMESKEQAARYVQTLPDISSLIVVLDPRDNFYKATGGYSMPEAVIYDKRGQIVEHFRGVTNKLDIENIINSLLNSSDQ